MKLIPEIVAAQDEIKTLRRDIHAHPELRYEELRTASLIAAKLDEWGIEAHRGIGGTGVVGVIRAGAGRRAIGLRADMDALPVQEVNSFAHRSQHAGKMHACGHDGHIAMLLAAARYLSVRRAFDGIVYLIFQPAEEGGAGAKAMIDDGLFTRFPMDAVFGLHNWPGIAAGNFAVTNGPIMASSNEFHIGVKGIGTHAAMPHQGRDPLFAAIQIANGLQSVITRSKDPLDAAVLSITQMHAGTAINVIPDEASLAGTVRTFSTDALDNIESRMRRISEATGAAHECEVDFRFKRNYPPTVNTDRETAIAVKIMQGIVGIDRVNSAVSPTTGAEDFSFMLQEKPGCYAFIGNGSGGHRDAGHGLGPCLLHNASYDFNDELLPLGGTYWVRLVENLLRKDVE